MARVSPYEVFTQGTIFSCACAEGYLDREVHGLVITARCDAAHGKTDIINYAPVVCIEDWLCVDGVRIVARRVAAEAAGQMRQAVRDAGMTSDILETQTPQDVLHEIQRESDRNSLRIAERFSKAVELYDGATAISSSEPKRADALDFLLENAKAYGILVRELLGHGIGDFHYLESIDEEEDCDGYVVILREIRFLPATIVKSLCDGMDLEHFEGLIPSSALREGVQLRFVGDDPYAMPISTVQSPDIEFILQRLTQLFARVGVRDVESARAVRLQSTLSRMKKGDE